jgi:4-hydroxy-3-methylbut-2-enyl diphosphate reductase
VGQNYGVKAYLVNDWNDVQPEWLEGLGSIGVTAGASAPEHLVEQIVAALNEKGFRELEEVEMVEEDVRFSLPPELVGAASSQLYGITATPR